MLAFSQKTSVAFKICQIEENNKPNKETLHCPLLHCCRNARVHEDISPNLVLSYWHTGEKILVTSKCWMLSEGHCSRGECQRDFEAAKSHS